MAVPVIQASFSAGELSPHLAGRVDLNKYKIGAARMHNFMVDYRGGAGKRAGTRFIGKTPYPLGKVLLIPFTFSVTQTAVLEFGNGYVRFIVNGAYTMSGSTPYAISTPYTDTQLAQLKWTQSADVLTLVHPQHAIRELTRFGVTDWRLTQFTTGTTSPTVAGLGLSATSTGFIDDRSAVYINYAYGVTTVGEDGTEGMLSPIGRLVNVLDMSAHAVTITVNWGQYEKVQYYNVYKATSGVNAQMPAGTRMGFVGSTRTLVYTDTNIQPNFTRTPPVHTNPFASGAITEVIITASGSGYSQGSYMQIVDPTGSGAVVNPIVVHNTLVGAIVENGGQNYTSPTVLCLGGSGGAAVARLGPATGVFPGAVAYFQQRLLFASTTNKPATIWGSKPGAFHNFDSGIPVTDDDAFEFTLASQQVNAIKYMIPMPGGLVVMTGGGAWQLSGTQQFAPVTPTAVMATPQAFNGCGDLQPITIGYEILFLQVAGSVVRNLSYNFFANIYTGADVTVLSSHFFSGHQMSAWAYAEEPDKVIWVVRDDGLLLSLTFLKEQEVAGWSQHSTNGSFRAVASIREGERDVTYFAVDRYNPVHGWYTAIERMATRRALVVEDNWFLDCALTTLPHVPQTRLYSGALQKTGTVFSTTIPVFAIDFVGKDIRAGGGKYRITTFISKYVVYADELVPATDYYFQEETGTKRMNPQEPGRWTIAELLRTVAGLGHLEGQKVSVFADGQMQMDKVVSDGRVVLDQEASKITIGLGYEAELQTLALESQPTIQTRRKKIPALTIRVQGTRGLLAGMTWETLTEVKERSPEIPPGQAQQVYDGDSRIVMDPWWKEEGQVCIKSVSGLPANILAVIPEVVLGDG